MIKQFVLALSLLLPTASVAQEKPYKCMDAEEIKWAMDNGSITEVKSTNWFLDLLSRINQIQGSSIKPPFTFSYVVVFRSNSLPSVGIALATDECITTTVLGVNREAYDKLTEKGI